MRYIVAFIVSLILYTVVSLGVQFGSALLWFNFTQASIDPLEKADYLSSLFSSPGIMATAVGMAAFVAGSIFSRISRAKGVTFSVILAVLVLLNQQSMDWGAILGALVLVLSLIGTWIFGVNAPNNSLKPDGPDGPPA